MMNLAEILEQAAKLIGKIGDLKWEHIWLLAYCATLLNDKLR